MVTETIVLVEYFEELEDPRSRDCPHNFMEILIICICAVICGMETWNEMALFARERQEWFINEVGFKLEHGVPSSQTFRRVISAIDPLKFQKQFIEWAQALSKKIAGDIVAIDGKTSCGSYDTSLDQNPIHIVSAWSTENGITLGQLAVDKKSNEITAIPELLDMLVLKGCIITIDAMGCQKNIASKIISKTAHYVFGLKGNQGFFAQQVRTHLDQLFDSKNIQLEHSFYEAPATVDHGRIEKRKSLAILIKPVDREYDSVQMWEGLRSAVIIERTRIDKATQKATTERAYYISSLEPDAKKLQESSQAHWDVENKLHWMLDMNFGEDSSRIRTGDAPYNLSAIRKVAYYHLKQETSQKSGIKMKQKKAALSPEYLKKILTTTVSGD